MQDMHTPVFAPLNDWTNCEKTTENKETPRHDGHCLNLSKEEIDRKIAAGEKYAYRLKIPEDGFCTFLDELRGEVQFEWKQIDHQIIQKSDGFPTYHLASIVDDHHMGITQWSGEKNGSIARPNTFFYTKVSDGNLQYSPTYLFFATRISRSFKRKNPTSIDYYKDAGFLPEAVVNYLGMMGYTLPDQREIFDLHEMSESFDIKRMSLGGPIFDIAKLKWLNGRYLRWKLSPEDVLERMIEWKANPEFLGKILPLALQRLETLSDFFPQLNFYYDARIFSRLVDGEIGCPNGR